MDKKTIKILGISAFFHDAAAVLIEEGKIVAAAQEERFTREKNTADFPKNAIQYCMEESGFSIDELDAVVFYEKPLLKFERLLQTYYSSAPKGIRSFLKAIPVWLGEKLFLKKRIREALFEIEPYDKKKLKLLFSSHHLSHAASAFFVSPYEKAAVLTIDGVGEWSTVSIGYGEGNSLRLIKEMVFPHSVGLLYSSFTYFLGFKVNSGEYKLMGLAPYGNPISEETNRFISLIKTKLISSNSDGSIWLNQDYFDYVSGLKMVKNEKWKQLFGIQKREDSDEILQSHCNLAYAIQAVTEEIVINLALEAKKITGADYLTMAGGVALNCVANGKLLEQNIFKDIYIQPASGDSGGALGAALAVHFLYFNQIRNPSSSDGMKGCFLGPSYSEKEIGSMIKKRKAVATKMPNEQQLLECVATHLSANKIVGWFQGRMEFGPRALGNRSILANPTAVEMQHKINVAIKFREGFRPFAPSVLVEDFSDYFKINKPSPYMLFTAQIREVFRTILPKNYADLSLWERIAVPRSVLPAVTHLDYSARIQTVDKETNPLFHKLLRVFKEKSGFGVLVNTSFNVRGEPIVCSPDEAYSCFMATDMEFLVIGDYVFNKATQPTWKDKKKWEASIGND